MTISTTSNVESCGQACHENLETELLISKTICKQIYKKEVTNLINDNQNIDTYSAEKSKILTLICEDMEAKFIIRLAKVA